jgi:hypothetical protein
MRRITIATAIAVTSMVLVAASNGSGRNFTATLSGDQEVPPVVTDTLGKANFHANEAETEIRFRLSLKRADDVLAVAGAHIHCAPAGQNGPVVAFLAAAVPGGFDGKVDIRATLTETNIVNPVCGATVSELLDAMQAGMTYVNVHSSAFPGGVVRGQIE